MRKGRLRRKARKRKRKRGRKERDKKLKRIVRLSWKEDHIEMKNLRWMWNNRMKKWVKSIWGKLRT